MKIDDFPIVAIDAPGQYRLIETSKLEQLLTGPNPSQSLFAVRRHDVAKLIIKFRINNGHTQDSLATACNIAEKTVRNLEAGRSKRKPHYSTIESLITELGQEFANELKNLIPINKEDYERLE